MAIVYADYVLPETSGIAEDLNLGAAGDSIVVPAGASLNLNTPKDSGGNTIFTSDGAGNLSSMNSAFTGSGKPVLITTNGPFSNVTTSDFTTGIDSTYKLYIFKLINIHVDTDNVELRCGFFSGVNWATNKTSTMISVDNTEADTASWTQNVSYQNRDTNNDVFLGYGLGNEAGENAAGEVRLFWPSNTTFFKNFTSKIAYNMNSNGARYSMVGGYCQQTPAVTGVRFSLSSGTFDGTIKMYGIT